jgi:hypothetical protein
MEQRLEQLHLEYQRGQQRWKALERERQELHDTMLRISGAIQVLQELLAARRAEEPSFPVAEVAEDTAVALAE